MFFVYLGFLYKSNIEGKFNIFSTKISFAVIAVQSLLWLTNKDYTPTDGVGLSYILVWGKFNDFLITILTSLTGIWITLYITEIIYPYLKDNKFIFAMGQNTYHIMTNHLFIMYLITIVLMEIKGIPIEIKNLHDIYWFVSPLKTTYFYFITTMFVSTYLGVGLNNMKSILINRFQH